MSLILDFGCDRNLCCVEFMLCSILYPSPSLAFFGPYPPPPKKGLRIAELIIFFKSSLKFANNYLPASYNLICLQFLVGFLELCIISYSTFGSPQTLRKRNHTGRLLLYNFL
uniref:Uncharacterized protein n=1 Tax=Opuntia streptacantha TaxID=393608 RepID=A0A7C9D3P6_OPUST